MTRRLILLSCSALILSGCGMASNAGKGAWSGTKKVWNGATSWLRDAPEQQETEYVYNDFENRGPYQGPVKPAPQTQTSGAAASAAPYTPQFTQSPAVHDPIERLPGSYDYPESGYVPSNPDMPIATARNQAPSNGGPVYFREESITPERQAYSYTPGAGSASTPVDTAPMSPAASRQAYSYSPGASASSAPPASSAATTYTAQNSAPASRPAYSYSPAQTRSSTAPAVSARTAETQAAPSTTRPAYTYQAPQSEPAPTYTPPASAYSQPAPAASYQGSSQPAYTSYGATASAPVTRAAPYDPYYDPAPAAPALVQSYAGYDSGSVAVYSAPGSNGSRTIGQRPGAAQMPGYATPSYSGSSSAPLYQQPAPAYQAQSQSRQPYGGPAPQAQSSTNMPNLSYVNMSGNTRTEDFQTCQARTGGAVIMTSGGARIAPRFDACMRQLGYLPEAEAQAKMSGR